MSLALLQAKKIIGNTKTNPAVGCIIVKDGNMISAGHTSINGRPHAEKNAINFSRIKMNNASMYVTLEPCSHFGKTPPCTLAIIKNKFKKVFLSIEDPDARSHYKSHKLLKSKNILVKNGFLKREIKNFYRSYIKFKKDKLPFVTAKLAISKDFYSVNLKKKWITNEFSRKRVHLIRSENDCLLTSSRTIIADNPELTCRIKGLEKTSPVRIILDKNLRIATSCNIVKSADKYKTIIFFNKSNLEKIKELKSLKVKLIKSSLDRDQNLNLKIVLKKIKLLGYSRVFLESGCLMTYNFLKNSLINDFNLFVSSKNLKKEGSKNFKKIFITFFKDKKSINERVNLFGDKLISYRMK